MLSSPTGGYTIHNAHYIFAMCNVIALCTDNPAGEWKKYYMKGENEQQIQKSKKKKE